MKTLRLLSVFLFSLFIIVFACNKSGDLINQNNSSAPLNKSLMLQLVNEQRQKGCNCGSVYYAPTTTVDWNDQLETAAAVHATDMDQNNYFSHTGLDGSSAGDRIRSAGYNWMAYGENIAKGYTTEQTVMAAWIASEEHCINIMNPAFREFGAAKSNLYWVQEFGSK
jgi:uncharacterized protein YkwD